MSCLKDKPHKIPKPGWYVCKKCGAASKKKKEICKPQKLKDKD